MDVHPGAELSVICVDLDTMADLHMRWMDLPGPTDVMSFPMDEPRPVHASPVMSPARPRSATSCCVRSSQRRRPGRRGIRSTMNWRCSRCTGVLHLLGYDHAEPEESARCSASRRRSSTSGTDRRLRDRSKRQSRRDEDLLRKTGPFDPDGD